MKNRNLMDNLNNLRTGTLSNLELHLNFKILAPPMVRPRMFGLLKIIRARYFLHHKNRPLGFQRFHFLLKRAFLLLRYPFKCKLLKNINLYPYIELMYILR